MKSTPDEEVIKKAPKFELKDVEVEEDEQFCCDECWNGYEAETFREKS